MKSTNFEDKLKRWKEAYGIYVLNSFTNKETTHISKALLLRGMELMNEGILCDEKQAFRSNKDFVFAVRLLLEETPKITKIQKELIAKTLKNFKLYSIIRIQGMKF
jgi:hypothetical protein